MGWGLLGFVLIQTRVLKSKIIELEPDLDVKLKFNNFI